MGKQEANHSHKPPAAVLEELPTIDIRELKRFGFLASNSTATISWNHCDEELGTARVECARDQIKISHRYHPHVGPSQTNRQCIALDYTEPHLGGLRPWFVCPDCGQRCAKIYMDMKFKCRSCTGRHYHCQHVGERHRLLARIVSIREQLEGLTVLGEFFPQRPKGMHKTRYRSLVKQHKLLESKLDQAEQRHDEAVFNNQAAGQH